MNIAIDTTPLLTGNAGRGVGIYTKELIEALAQIPEIKLTFFSKNVSIQGQVDVVHYPYFDPFFPTLPIRFTYPTVITVHDLTPIVLPDLFPLGIKGKLVWGYQKARLLQTRRIITDSVSSKNDIARILKYDLARIDPVYLAPSYFFGGPGKPYTQKLPNQYMMYVGDVNANKNIPALITAFGKIFGTSSQYASTGMQLLLVGKSFMNNSLVETHQINETIQQLDNPELVKRTGYVPDEELVTLYRHACCLIHPSLYEGFGLPVLEAMLAGCPVISTNTGSLPEIAGPSIMCNPTIEGLSVAIKQMLELSEGNRMLQIDKGRKWAEKFTWTITAQNTVEAYKRTMKSC